jgi:methanogenic corrinoid protein MtbC1
VVTQQSVRKNKVGGSMSSFGTRLKAYRKECGLSQKDLASQLDIGQTTVANYEKDLRFPNASTLIKIADVLNVTLDNLLGRAKTNKTFDLEISRQLFIQYLLDHKAEQAKELILEIAKNDYDVIDLYHGFLTSTLHYLGELWLRGDITIAMEHYVTSIVEQILVLLTPYINVEASNGKRAAFITPSNEPHLIGLKVVKETFRKHGWDTLFIGNSVPWNTLVETLKDKSIDLIVISITMTTNLNQAQALVNHIRSHTKTKVMLGGQAIQTQEHVIEFIESDYFIDSREALQAFLEKK